MKIKLLNGETHEKDLLLDNMQYDSFYYGVLGKKALSSSAIKLLLTSPKKYYFVTKYGEELNTQGIRDGRLLHTLILEPQKFEEFVFVDVQSKNTKAYREAKEKHGVVYTRAEKENAEKLADQFLRNEAAMQLISNSEFEVPAIDLLHGHAFRGKADILGRNGIVDIKTTTDINSFKYSAVKYGYDVQCYLYCQLFNKQYYDFKFLVIDKGSCDLAIFDCSEEFYNQGMEKTKFAVERYNEFFKDKSWDTTEIAEELDNYIIRDIL